MYPDDVHLHDWAIRFTGYSPYGRTMSCGLQDALTAAPWRECIRLGCVAIAVSLSSLSGLCMYYLHEPFGLTGGLKN